MRDRQRRQIIRDIERRVSVIKTDLWAVYKWADMANFPSSSGGGAGDGQVGGHSDPVGDKATAAASGHYDDPSIRAAKQADTTLYRIMRNLQTLEWCISTAKAPKVLSERDLERCESCGRPRFENPSGWTLGKCKSCYDVLRRVRRRHKR